jgi:hypothetical protein
MLEHVMCILQVSIGVSQGLYAYYAALQRSGGCLLTMHMDLL